MVSKIQSTALHRYFGNALERLDFWAINPWRRYSFLLIILLIGFFVGSSIGMINGALALMDPVGAFFTILLIEIMVRLRNRINYLKKRGFALMVVDTLRIGLLYGLLMEGFKLL